VLVFPLVGWKEEMRGVRELAEGPLRGTGDVCLPGTQTESREQRACVLGGKDHGPYHQ